MLMEDEGGMIGVSTAAMETTGVVLVGDARLTPGGYYRNDGREDGSTAEGKQPVVSLLGQAGQQRKRRRCKAGVEKLQSWRSAARDAAVQSSVGDGWCGKKAMKKRSETYPLRMLGDRQGRY